MLVSGFFFSGLQGRERTAEFHFVIIGTVLSGSNSAVECDLAKVEVAGSNPVSRSSLSFGIPPPSLSAGVFGVWQAVFENFGARYPSGKGEVCKTFMRRFDSDPRLQIFLAVD